MKNFFVIVNRSKKDIDDISHAIKEYIQNKGGKCIIDKKAENDTHVNILDVPDDTEGIIVLGGDGTLLQAASDLYTLNIPFLGINLGTLGFLSAAEKNDFEAAIDKMFDDDYIIEERMMLSGVINDDKNAVNALNEIVVTGNRPMQLVNLSVYVNGQLLHKYIADGLIIATPTGSTGYSMSAGGPIMNPTAKNIILTPICQHSMHNRSIVLSPEDTIRIDVDLDRYGNSQDVECFFDSKNPISLSSEDSVTIGKAFGVANIIKLKQESFLETLHNKLKD